MRFRCCDSLRVLPQIPLSLLIAMPYKVGGHIIKLEAESKDGADFQILSAHPRLLRFCLNEASFNYLIRLKRIIHLYCDIAIIYSTLLRKIPYYDDITSMTNRTKHHLLMLEQDFNALLGPESREMKDEFQVQNRGLWETRPYEGYVKKMCMLSVESAIEVFDATTKTLNCIDIFFSDFDNLKKLLIPFLASHTKSLQHLLAKSLYLFKLTTITDDVESICGSDQINASVSKQLRKIEKITAGIERESTILRTLFRTFDPSLQQYTSILLGKAILKRDVDPQDCQIVRRRNICFQAAEHVVSIPLSESQFSALSIKSMSRYMLWGFFVLFLLVSLMVHRLVRLVSGW